MKKLFNKIRIIVTGLNNIDNDEFVIFMTGFLIDFALFGIIGLLLNLFVSISVWYFVGGGVFSLAYWLYRYIKYGFKE